MSSELEKQFFIQKHLSQKQGEKLPEKPQVPSKVSPEKREEAIQYAREIRRIREKEILTEEDSARVEELAEKLKRIYSPEIQFESEKAKERFKKLKQTPLWDEEREQWNWSMNEDQELENSSRTSYSQLLGVLIEAITGNSEEAKKRLEKLKETSLWDREREQWNWYIDENQKLINSSRSSPNQFLGVLAEAVTGNPEEAKERLEKLKETLLWDKKRKQWNEWINENQKLQSLARYSEIQLLGVLVEAVTGNPEEAKERLEKLKQTPLWDEKREQWNWYIGEDQEPRSSFRLSNDQFLGVLAEAFHEKEEGFVKWLIKEK